MRGAWAVLTGTMGVCLACGGVSTYTFIDTLVEIEQIPEVEHREQVRSGVVNVALLCEDGAVKAGECRDIRRAVDEALEDGLSNEEWQALGEAHPQLLDQPKGALSDAIVKRVERKKNQVLDDYTRWDEAHMAARVKAAGWDLDECDFEVKEDYERIRCKALVDKQLFAVRAVKYPSRDARDKAVEESYFTGYSQADANYRINGRLYDEALTRELSAKAGFLADDFQPEVTEKAVRAMLMRATEEVYDCETTEESVVCNGGRLGYVDVLELSAGKGEPEGAEVFWSDVSLRRDWPDGHWVRAEYIDTNLSAVTLDAYLDAM